MQFQFPEQLIPVLITVLWGVLSASPLPELEPTLFELTLQNPFPKENFPHAPGSYLFCPVFPEPGLHISIFTFIILP